MNNRYFSKKPVACPRSSHDLEMAALKYWLYSSVRSGNVVSYKRRIWMFTVHGDEGVELRIIRTASPNVSMDLRADNPQKAVDFFLECFVYENDLDLNAVHAGLGPDTGDPAIPWAAAKSGLTLDEIMSGKQQPDASSLEFNWGDDES